MGRLHQARGGGFTLIEMSIVLVIIGLIVGGVLVGQDLIRAAAVRAQISQIEKYNTAVNTFKGKYGYLPGDISGSAVAQFGFVARAGTAGQGDGNGVIEGYASGYGNSGYFQAAGETVMAWVDLSTAGLIEGNFSTATPNNAPAIPSSSVPLYLPGAKLGQNDFIYIWSGGTTGSDGTNYFGLSTVLEIDYNRQIWAGSTPGVTVQQAYSIDKKIDDGLPQSGNVEAFYLTGGVPYWQWARADGLGGDLPGSQTAPHADMCYDTRGAVGVEQYAIEESGGSGVNCALSFRFQ
jgi:prepilin-type N-terminal cleavage/methylation domain-containing protein